MLFTYRKYTKFQPRESRHIRAGIRKCAINIAQVCNKYIQCIIIYHKLGVYVLTCLRFKWHNQRFGVSIRVGKPLADHKFRLACVSNVPMWTSLEMPIHDQSNQEAFSCRGPGHGHGEPLCAGQGKSLLSAAARRAG